MALNLNDFTVYSVMLHFASNRRKFLMPLTFLFPLGLFMVIAGIFLYSATKYKLIARLIIALGLALIILTIGVIILSVNSM